MENIFNNVFGSGQNQPSKAPASNHGLREHSNDNGFREQQHQVNAELEAMGLENVEEVKQPSESQKKPHMRPNQQLGNQKQPQSNPHMRPNQQLGNQKQPQSNPHMRPNQQLGNQKQPQSHHSQNSQNESI